MDKETWPCGRCDKAYTSKRNLRRHMTAMHNMTLGVDGNEIELLGDNLLQAQANVKRSQRNNRERARDALLAATVQVNEDTVIVIEPTQQVSPDFVVTINADWVADNDMFQTISLEDLASTFYPSSSTPLEGRPGEQPGGSDAETTLLPDLPTPLLDSTSDLDAGVQARYAPIVSDVSAASSRSPTPLQLATDEPYSVPTTSQPPSPLPLAITTTGVLKQTRKYGSTEAGAPDDRQQRDVYRFLNSNRIRDHLLRYPNAAAGDFDDQILDNEPENMTEAMVRHMELIITEQAQRSLCAHFLEEADDVNGANYETLASGFVDLKAEFRRIIQRPKTRQGQQVFAGPVSPPLSTPGRAYTDDDSPPEPIIELSDDE